MLNLSDNIEHCHNKMTTVSHMMASRIHDETLSSCADILNSESTIDILRNYLNILLSVVYPMLSVLYPYKWYILLTVIVIYALYKSFWNHVRYAKELTDLGYEHIKPGPDRMAKISRAQSARQTGAKIPPPYPNGWFALVQSRDLGVGGVVSVDALGQNFCIYRGEDGIARCVDAYCPHMGANLGVGGTVCGNCIKCPFHNWSFGESGACVSIPGEEHPLHGVSLKTWTTVEADDSIWVWHDAEGRDPLWGLEDAPELKSWGYRGRNQFLANVHVQEIPENGADIAHLNVIHAPSLLTNLGQKYPRLVNIIGCHVWTADWSRNEDHTATLNMKHVYRILNLDVFHLQVDVTQIGPGHVRLRLKTPVGPVMVSQSVTPIAPRLQKVVHRLYSPFYNAPIVALLVKPQGDMFEKDFSVWNNKRYVSAPMYSKNDKPVRSFRSWFSQFYSEHSMSFRDAMQKPLDW